MRRPVGAPRQHIAMLSWCVTSWLQQRYGVHKARCLESQSCVDSNAKSRSFRPLSPLWRAATITLCIAHEKVYVMEYKSITY